MTFTRWSSS